MVDFLMIFGVLGASRNEKSWIQMLVPIIFAIFYIVAAISKTKNAKKQSMSESILEKADDAMPEMDFEFKRAPKIEIKQAAVHKPSFSQMDLRRIPQTMPAEKVETENVSAIDFEEQDSLRNAIVYHEIFSKPLSLRDAGEENRYF